jgi:hypothetical protein
VLKLIGCDQALDNLGTNRRQKFDNPSPDASSAAVRESLIVKTAALITVSAIQN